MRSSLEIYDLASGNARVVLQSDRHIEAPNWDPSGTSLLVNAEGRLFRVPLDAPALQPVETGPATRCNNDHGISPDGRYVRVATGFDYRDAAPISGMSFGARDKSMVVSLRVEQ